MLRACSQSDVPIIVRFSDFGLQTLFGGKRGGGLHLDLISELSCLTFYLRLCLFNDSGSSVFFNDIRVGIDTETVKMCRVELH